MFIRDYLYVCVRSNGVCVPPPVGPEDNGARIWDGRPHKLFLGPQFLEVKCYARHHGNLRRVRLNAGGANTHCDSVGTLVRVSFSLGRRKARPQIHTQVVA
jgi:hypothetical protein